MICSSICACVGQLLWKLSADGGFLFLMGGFFLYGIGAVTMIIAYKFGKVSILQPILSLNIIPSTPMHLVRVIVSFSTVAPRMMLRIMLGVLLIAGGDEVKDADR